MRRVSAVPELWARRINDPTEVVMKRYRLTLFAAALIGTMMGIALPAGAQQSDAEYWGYSWPSTTVPNPTPDDFQGNVVQVATSNSTWYAIKANGSVKAWGVGNKGQLGNGTEQNSMTPVTVQFPADVHIAYMADTSPQASALAVDTTGQVWGWGSNSYGELCTSTKHIDVPIKLPFTAATAIAGAGDHTLVVNDGALEACGGNVDGDLGDGSTTQSYTPVTIPLTGVTSVYASWRNSAALTSTGQLYSWGYNGLGEVGNGTTTDAWSPVPITLAASVTSVALGGSGRTNGQVLAIAGGHMYAWGSDAWSQLGDGQTTTAVTSPEAVNTPEPFVTVKTGGQTSYGIGTTGNLWAWGDNSMNQIGAAYPSSDPTPVEIATGIIEVSTTLATVEDLS
jgi:alpha-tubulin suppressor-like RCC1 family protein